MNRGWGRQRVIEIDPIEKNCNHNHIVMFVNRGSFNVNKVISEIRGGGVRDRRK